MKKLLRVLMSVGLIASFSGLFIHVNEANAATDKID